jgi:transcriptional regulator with XRE-family HTH domain
MQDLNSMPTHGPDEADNHPGRALKAARLELGKTLTDVAKLTGLPISTLSKIENGKMGMSYDRLLAISQSMGVDLAKLISNRAPSRQDSLMVGRRSITRAGEGEFAGSKKYRHAYLANDLLNKQMAPILVEVQARSLAEVGEMLRHAGEEFILVLEGELILHTECYAPLHLATGDSIYFDSGMAHAYVAGGTSRCRLLSVCTGPGIENITRRIHRADDPDESGHA